MKIKNIEVIGVFSQQIIKEVVFRLRIRILSGGGGMEGIDKASENHNGFSISLFDSAGEDFELVRVVSNGSFPEQGIGRFIFALPVVDTSLTMRDQLGHKAGIFFWMKCRGGWLKVSRVASRPHRTGVE